MKQLMEMIAGMKAVQEGMKAAQESTVTTIAGMKEARESTAATIVGMKEAQDSLLYEFHLPNPLYRKVNQ